MKQQMLIATLAGLTLATPVLERANAQGPTINFSNNTGTPKQLASGIIYGLPDDPNQIPANLLSGFGFNYARASGAQVGHGWTWSQTDYAARFKSSLSNYRLTRKFNGGFVLMLHDLWGFDTTQNSSALAPGDNGDWSSYDAFLNAVIRDIKRSKMQPGLVIDIWNEPEGSGFWARSIDQWLEMWGRGFHKLRAAFPSSSVALSGPTTAGQPSPDYDWWSRWAQFVNSNNSIPDQYAWHEESGTGSSLSRSYDGLQRTLKQYGLPQRTININEYAVFDEQVPAGSAFWIGQHERINAIGLRGNWLGGTQLHDLAASLLGKTNPDDPTGGGYFPNGDWQVYNYYATKMVGHRVGTSVSADGLFDAYATVGNGTARVLMGVRPPTMGTYDVHLTGLTNLGLPSAGSVSVTTWKFPVANDWHYGRVDAAVNLGAITHTYTGGQLVLPYYQTDRATTYAWEFSVNV